MIGEGGEPEAVIPLSKISEVMRSLDTDGNGSNSDVQAQPIHIENVNIASDYDASRLLNTLGIQQDLYNKGVVSNG